MESKNSSGRIEWIDTARGLAVMLVFVGHLHPPYLSTWIYTCHVPLLFFVSGLVFSMHPFKTFLSKKFQRLVIPYFCLGAVIYLFWAGIYLYEHREITDYWTMFLQFIEQKAFWTVWFLAALFLAEMLLWVELKMCKENKYLALLPSVILMCVAFLYYRMGGTTLPWCLDVACIAQFFILLGFIFKSHWSKIKIDRKLYLYIPVLLLINIITGFACIRFSGAQLDMSVGLYGNEVLSLISALSGIAAIILICMMISNRFLKYLGQNTMVFFAWHSRIIIVACGMIYGVLGWFQTDGFLSSIAYTITTLILILATLYPATEGLKRTKIGKYFGL